MTFKFTEAHVTALLEAKYSGQEWAFFSQVPNSTGGSTRSADGVAFNLFPSRGLEIHGFEIKVSRSDWLNELKNPHKSEAIQKFCDRWYIVAPKDVVRDYELPKTWGLIIVSEKSLRIKTKAPPLKPESPDINFIAAVMRKCKQFTVDSDIVSAKINNAYQSGISDGRSYAVADSDRTNRNYNELKEVIEKFYQATGVHLTSYNLPHSIEIFKAVRSLKDTELVKALNRKIEVMEGNIREMSALRDLASEQIRTIQNVHPGT